jgi:hypothetical protein
MEASTSSDPGCWHLQAGAGQAPPDTLLSMVWVGENLYALGRREALQVRETVVATRKEVLGAVTSSRAASTCDFMSSCALPP